jgi:hypothetical protein
MYSYRDLSAALPLKPGCSAAQWGRTVCLYYRGACCALIDLGEGEEPTAELIYRRCEPARWELVSDWEPAGEPSGSR